MSEISIQFDAKVHGYIVRFPARVTLGALQRWGANMRDVLVNRAGVGLLIDTNTHDFESIECLRWLKQFLTEDPVLEGAVVRAAFVQPERFRRSEIVGDTEAYFSDVESARAWLARKSRPGG